MKVMFPRGELREALSGLQRVIPSRATLPILQCVRFSVAQDQLTALATDLDHTAVYRFHNATTQNRVGIAIVEGSRLKTLARGADEEPIEIEATGGEVTLANTI